MLVRELIEKLSKVPWAVAVVLASVACAQPTSPCTVVNIPSAIMQQYAQGVLVKTDTIWVRYDQCSLRVLPAKP